MHSLASEQKSILGAGPWTGRDGQVSGAMKSTRHLGDLNVGYDMSSPSSELGQLIYWLITCHEKRRCCWCGVPLARLRRYRNYCRPCGFALLWGARKNQRRRRHHFPPYRWQERKDYRIPVR